MEGGKEGKVPDRVRWAIFVLVSVSVLLLLSVWNARKARMVPQHLAVRARNLVAAQMSEQIRASRRKNVEESDRCLTTVRTVQQLLPSPVLSETLGVDVDVVLKKMTDFHVRLCRHVEEESRGKSSRAVPTAKKRSVERETRVGVPTESSRNNGPPKDYRRVRNAGWIIPPEASRNGKRAQDHHHDPSWRPL